MYDAQIERPADVFIVGLPRTGTTVLRAWLAENGGIDCNEIFTSHLHKPHSYYGYLQRQMAEQPDIMLPWNQRPAFESFLDHMRQDADGLPLIIDTKYHTLNYIPTSYNTGDRRPYLFSYMRGTGSRMIHLIRRNKLRVIASEEISKATGVWGMSTEMHAKRGDLAKTPVTLDPARTLAKIRKMRRMDLGIREVFSDLPGYHRLRYEDMFAPDGSFSREALGIAARVLGRPVAHDTPPHHRLNPDPLPELISNFDAVAEALQGTRFAWMVAPDA